MDNPGGGGGGVKYLILSADDLNRGFGSMCGLSRMSNVNLFVFLRMF